MTSSPLLEAIMNELSSRAATRLGHATAVEQSHELIKQLRDQGATCALGRSVTFRVASDRLDVLLDDELVANWRASIHGAALYRTGDLIAVVTTLEAALVETAKLIVDEIELA